MSTNPALTHQHPLGSTRAASAPTAVPLRTYADGSLPEDPDPPTAEELEAAERAWRDGELARVAAQHDPSNGKVCVPLALASAAITSNNQQAGVAASPLVAKFAGSREEKVDRGPRSFEVEGVWWEVELRGDGAEQGMRGR